MTDTLSVGKIGWTFATRISCTSAKDWVEFASGDAYRSVPASAVLANYSAMHGTTVACSGGFQRNRCHCGASDRDRHVSLPRKKKKKLCETVV